MSKPKLSPTERLERIADILDVAEQRCLVADGPVSTIQNELTTLEIRKLYLLATGKWMAKK